MNVRLIAPILLFLLLWAAGAAAGAPDDRAALAGLKSARAFFDVNLAEAGKLPLYLQVIEQTHAGLKAQGAAPDFVVAFRGPAVTLVTRKAPPEVAALVERLAAAGVRLEACNVAMGLFKVDNGNLLPPIRVVGNTFISAIGYGSRGYVSIPIQ